MIVRDPETDATMFARVKVPPLLPRFLEASPDRFTPLEDVIAAHLGQLFVGMEVVEHHAFRVTRNQDLEIDDDIARASCRPWSGSCCAAGSARSSGWRSRSRSPTGVLDLLTSELAVDEGQIYRVDGPLDLGGLASIADLDRPELKYPPFVPSKDALPEDASVFAAIRERDVLVHHPYDSFTTTVQRLIEDAASDPQVLAIKQTLYRTSGDSPIVDALMTPPRPASRSWSWWS